MSIVFPLPGVRGSFLHSAGVLLPFLFAAALPGLEVAVGWVSEHRRGWKPARAYRVFGSAMVAICVLVGGLLFTRTVFAANGSVLPWNQRDAIYSAVAAWAAGSSGAPGLVMVGNPPAYYNRSRQACVVTPSDGYMALRDVAQRYGVRWLVLEANRPAYLDTLWDSDTGPEWLTLATELDNGSERVRVYEIH
jgi:hypothetical protein